MKGGIVVALVSALVVGLSLGAATAGSRVIDLDASPSPSSLAQAREAYRRGDIIRIIGGTPADLQRLLGASVADAWSPHELAPMQVIAIRVAPNGSLRQFTADMTSPGDGSPVDWSSAFTAWMDRELRPAEPADAARAGDPQSPPAAWTELWSSTVNAKDGSENAIQATVTVFRLNDTSTVRS